ncbi:MAG: nitrogenase component 1 [Candidatus Methanoperedens sp.]
MSKNYATVNPCVMCMPMGSVLAFRGIENTMPMFHGSQGCSTYIRLHLAHHFREPIDIASSALSERGAVYGGTDNLKMGLKNVIEGYNPRIIGVATTCLAETIGEDVPGIISEFRQEEGMADDITIIPVSTPSYRGSHEEGYNETLKAIVQSLASPALPNEKLNLVIGAIVSPADIRYLKQMLDELNCNRILLPDFSDTFDAPLVENNPKMPAGGTPIDDVKDMANSSETLSLGICTQAASAGGYLENTFNIPHTRLPLPIGLEYTDMFAWKLEEITGQPLPGKYESERGRLLDTMVDVHKYVAHVKICVFGDTDTVLGITKLVSEIGMDPVVIASGTHNPVFAEAVKNITPGSTILHGCDFTDIHREIKNHGVELMLGPFTGRQISMKENIPLIRVGLPNHDRVGAARQLVVGYEGAARLVDTITNTLLELEDKNKTVTELII